LISSKWVLLVSVVVLTFLYSGIHNPRNGARLMVFDVGQGLAVLWEDYSIADSEAVRVMFDTGYGNEFYQSAESTWLPFFKKHNISRINSLIVSHNDADHSGGLRTFKNNVSADSIYSGQPLVSNPNSQLCHQNKPLLFANTRLTFLSAFAEDALTIQKDNNQSCVVMIEYFGSKILLPGDIEVAAEKRLLNNELLVPVEVVVAPHHGSNTSSSQKFISAINPIYSLFSTGYLNRYKFPRTKVTERYQNLGAIMLNTAEHGAIECRWEQTGIFVGCFGLRDQDWGRWH